MMTLDQAIAVRMYLDENDTLGVSREAAILARKIINDEAKLILKTFAIGQQNGRPVQYPNPDGKRMDKQALVTLLHYLTLWRAEDFSEDSFFSSGDWSRGDLDAMMEDIKARITGEKG